MPTTSEALAYLAAHGRTITGSRLRKLIHAGQIHAVKHGRDWWITEKELDRYLAQPYHHFGGRPRKEQK